MQLVHEPQPELKPVVATRAERKFTGGEGEELSGSDLLHQHFANDIDRGFKVGNIQLIRLDVDAAVLSLSSAKQDAYY